MSSSVSVDEMADEINKALTEYGSVVADDLKKAVQKVANSAKKELQSTSPKDTGKYAKGWTVTKTTDTSTGRTVVVRNKTSYRLAHLLENGHAKKNGGRVKAYPHIKPVEEEAIKEFESAVEALIKGGG